MRQRQQDQTIDGSGEDVTPPPAATTAIQGQQATIALRGSADDVLGIIEKRNRALVKCQDIAIASTHPADWQKMGDRYHPTRAAVAKMIRTFGISISNVNVVRSNDTDDDGPFYTYRYTATFSQQGLALGPINATGTAHSRDQFLSTTRSGPDLEMAVLKKAETNAYERGVTELCGIHPHPEDFERAWGAERAGTIGAVDYQKGGAGKGTDGHHKLPWGRSKGTAVPEATDADLRYFAGELPARVNDPEAAKYKKQNQALLGAIVRELEKRKQQVPPNAYEAAGIAPAAAAAGSEQGQTTNGKGAA